jgi:lauroyl/myristoyl acyltransferase
MHFHLSRVLCTLPDRLVLPRWRERCRIEGEANLLAARAGGRPVILATLHYGGMLLLRYWLRVLGHPAAMLVREQLAQRSPLKQRKDALSATDAGPVVVSGQSPRDALRYLREGGLLTVMLDHTEGRQIDAPLPGGRWRISTTALRLAAAAKAVVLPALVVETAPWRFVIHVGRPVPGEWLADARQFPAAAGHLWNEFLPVLRAAPHDALPELFNSLRSETNEI